MLKLLFNLIALFHIFIWVFILFAFINKKLASLNLYYIIPIIYILHILPFHILIYCKEKMYEDWEEKDKNIQKMLIIPYYFTQLQHYLDKNTTGSPISAQGMLIFGAISSAYVLKC